MRAKRELHIDATGLHALERLARRCRRTGIRLVLAGLQAQPMEALARSGLAADLGEEGLAPLGGGGPRPIRGPARAP